MGDRWPGAIRHFGVSLRDLHECKFWRDLICMILVHPAIITWESTIEIEQMKHPTLMSFGSLTDFTMQCGTAVQCQTISLSWMRAPLCQLSSTWPTWKMFAMFYIKPLSSVQVTTTIQLQWPWIFIHAMLSHLVELLLFTCPTPNVSPQKNRASWAMPGLHRWSIPWYKWFLNGNINSKTLQNTQQTRKESLFSVKNLFKSAK